MAQANNDLSNAVDAGKYVVPSTALAGAITVLINEFVQVLSPEAIIAVTTVLTAVINIVAYITRKRLEK